MEKKPEKVTTMNVSLPESLRSFAEERASVRYSSASEYIRDLIRRDQKDAARERLEELLIEGLESGKPVVVTEDYWEKKREELVGRHRKKKRK
jgi:antitoxin ParD1/3/4